MKNGFPTYCPVCGKGKGHAFKGINHERCAKVMQAQQALAKKKVSTQRMTSQAVDFFAKTGT